MKPELCAKCENKDICIIRRNSETSIARCCIFCSHCKSYNWSCKNGPNIFYCNLDRPRGIGYLSEERHSCGKFKQG